MRPTRRRRRARARRRRCARSRRRAPATGLKQSDEQRALPRAAGRRVAVEHLEVVDAVQRRLRASTALARAARRSSCVASCATSRARSWPLRCACVRRIDVLDRDAQRARRRPRPRRASTRDQVAEPLLQRALHQDICVAAASSALFGANTSCSRPLPKSGRFTRSPGRGEQHLLDQVADVVVVVGVARCGRGRRSGTGSRCSCVLTSRSRASASTTGSSGVPVGAQIAWLSMQHHRLAARRARASPRPSTAPVTHGPLARRRRRTAQPATTYGAAMRHDRLAR